VIRTFELWAVVNAGKQQMVGKLELKEMIHLRKGWMAEAHQ
jgi:hypothetical protein